MAPQRVGYWGCSREGSVTNGLPVANVDRGDNRTQKSQLEIQHLRVARTVVELCKFVDAFVGVSARSLAKEGRRHWSVRSERHTSNLPHNHEPKSSRHNTILD